jgi:hypothetical protein
VVLELNLLLVSLSSSCTAQWSTFLSVLMQHMRQCRTLKRCIQHGWLNTWKKQKATLCHRAYPEPLRREPDDEVQWKYHISCQSNYKRPMVK